MSGPPLKKQRAVYPVEEYVSEEEESSDNELLGETVESNFDAFKAQDNDFHGIKSMLKQTFCNLPIDFSGLAETVISQNYVGSVVKQTGGEDEEEEDEEDDNGQLSVDKDDIFGLTTIINLTSRKDEEAISGLRSVLIEKCHKHGDDAVNILLREALGNESTHVGLLISERLVNLPPQFAMPLYDSLVKEVEEAKKDKMPYDFKYIVIVVKVFKAVEKKSKKASKNLIDIVWSNAEEEILDEECEMRFEWEVEQSSGLWDYDNDQLKPWRRVLVFPAKILPHIITKMKEAIL